MILASPEQVRAARMQKDLAYFVKEMWPVIEPGVPLVWNWHMDVLCKYLERITNNEIRHLLISIPPGTGKSIFTSVMWCAWEWLSRPWETTIFASNAEDLAERDSIKCRQLIGSPEYQEVLRLLYESRCLDRLWDMHPQLDKKDHFGTTAGGFRQALTVNKPITGKRPMKAVIDDPTDASEVTRFDQDTVRKSLDDVFTWYSKVLSTRLNNVQTGHFVIIMQRLHEMDLVGRLKNNPNYTLLCFPMEYDPEIACPEDPRREPGELLFPERFPRWWVEEQKGEDQLGRIQYAAQHGQRPMPASGGLFREEFFRHRYDWVRPPPREDFILVMASADIANKAKKKNDQSSIKLLGLHKSGFVYLLGSVSFRKEFVDMVPLFLDTMLVWNDRWQVQTVVIEDAANGVALLSTVGRLLDHAVPLSLLAPHERAFAGAFRGRLAVTPEKATEGKAVRASAQRVWYAPQCRVVIPTADCPWIDTHITQHLRFGSSEHDDDVDAMCQGLKHIAMFAPPKTDQNYSVSASHKVVAESTAGLGTDMALSKKDVEYSGGRRSSSRFMLPNTARGW